ncbi:hypothetical protein Trydic_g11125 [Trypoxylus dichotomus]
MKIVLCLVFGFALGVIGELTESTDPVERALSLEISLLRSNLVSPEHATRLISILRQAWLTYNNVGARATNFASLASTYLDALGITRYTGLTWSVVVNEEALYHQGEFFAKFKRPLRRPFARDSGVMHKFRASSRVSRWRPRTNNRKSVFAFSPIALRFNLNHLSSVSDAIDSRLRHHLQ